MSSYDYGKDKVLEWIHENVPTDATILDVGSCDGKWRTMLSEYPNVDACDIFAPNIEATRTMYRESYCMDILDYKYKHYDLVIFGDIIEHMDVGGAQAALKYAKAHSNAVIVSVPYRYPQGALYGNPWEAHIQADLTESLFDERYPGFKPLMIIKGQYGHYIYIKPKRKTNRG